MARARFPPKPDKNWDKGVFRGLFHSLFAPVRRIAPAQRFWRLPCASIAFTFLIPGTAPLPAPGSGAGG